MDGRGTPESGSVRWELESGLARAWQAHYADAADHFARARDQIPSTHPHVITALDAFVQSHARYWQAEQALHEASLRFSSASLEQQSRLEDLHRLVTAIQDDLEHARTTPTGGSHTPVNPEHDWDAAATPENLGLPPLSITCFGGFEVQRAGQPVPLCQNRNGQTILRYLVAQPRHRESMDALVEALWPGDDPDVTRHKLHVAISALRRSLNGEYARQRGMGYLLCENGSYQLNPAVPIHIDAEEFVTLYRAGEHLGGTAAIPKFEAACRLYRGPFLPEDLYADWSIIRREQLTQTYLVMCTALATHYLAINRPEDAAHWARAILEENRCDETAYRQLMRAYAGQGRRSEALRQYQRCERVLAEELGVQPMPETKTLFGAILRGEALPAEGDAIETDERSDDDERDARSA